MSLSVCPRWRNKMYLFIIYLLLQLKQRTSLYSTAEGVKIEKVLYYFSWNKGPACTALLKASGRYFITLSETKDQRVQHCWRRQDPEGTLLLQLKQWTTVYRTVEGVRKVLYNFIWNKGPACTALLKASGRYFITLSETKDQHVQHCWRRQEGTLLLQMKQRTSVYSTAEGVRIEKVLYYFSWNKRPACTALLKASG